MSLYIVAEEVTVDNDEGRFVLRVLDVDGVEVTIDIHPFAIDFYNNVESTIGTYSREADHARRTMPQAITTPVDDVYAAIDAGYALDDPKHPTYGERFADAVDIMRKAHKEAGW